MNLYIIATLVLVALSAPLNHKVTETLPYCDPIDNMYSGYLKAGEPGEGKFHHYVYVESTGSPETDPLLIWFNGGPGCSSMSGFISLHGPCVFMNEGDAHPSPNPYTWTQNASIMYLETPVGTGFNNDMSMDYDDEAISHDNLRSVVDFLQYFPELKGRDLYLVGESYAGVYIPYLALRILEHNDAGLEKINLQGILVGNGITDWNVDALPALTKMAYAHGLMDKELKARFDAHPYCDFRDVFGAPNATCDALLD
jgi:carboxypeptidase C (cathepsin A)